MSEPTAATKPRPRKPLSPAMVWIVLTAALAAGLWMLCGILPHSDAKLWIIVGATASLVTCLLSALATKILQNTGENQHPLVIVLAPMMMHSGLPLFVLLVVEIVDPGLLGQQFLVYCLPFQVVTLVVECTASLQRVAPQRVNQTQRTLDS